MDIVSKSNKKQLLSFSQKLFLSVISLFLVFVLCFLAFQYKREKEYKIDLLDIQLQDYNERLAIDLIDIPEARHDSMLQAYATKYMDKHLRITLIDLQGNVLCDSYARMEHTLGNHANRPEIQKALKIGKGYDLRRTSETTGENYFYSATRFSNYIIRSALPYNLNLINHLAADVHYLWFTAIVSLVLLLMFYTLTSKLGRAIIHLREFAQHADKDEPIEMDALSAFPHNELGDISKHIIQIYKRLRRTKEALYIEREKLITHLQTAREGLGVFTKEKREILVNSLFAQYANLISDYNLHTTEAIFLVDELHPITEFISFVQSRPLPNEAKQMSLNINKNGRVFLVVCNIFQDLSFEISINDITQEEEQRLLKRQLTQNIAHELKTPVSSIQGYLETIVTNETLPEERKKLFLERCYVQSNRLSRLLRDISVLTRIDEAANMVEIEQLDITQLVNGMLNEVAWDLEQRAMKVDNELTTPLSLRGNYSLIYSIFRNLMDNAIAYAGNETTITIRLFREDDQYYYFSFSDTGVGVPEEHLGRLFERFYRIDKGRSRKLGGTGLGLAIVKNAVLIHGGTISAKNAQGSGLEFIFTLKKSL
ncbi:MAG: two-component sensor histidine kinase [Mediterranea massiliensis]|nr:two-component sensor histidine kinase [Mediterranea massiliensis]